jgi:hypothetical protein
MDTMSERRAARADSPARASASFARLLSRMERGLPVGDIAGAGDERGVVG